MKPRSRFPGAAPLALSGWAVGPQKPFYSLDTNGFPTGTAKRPPYQHATQQSISSSFPLRLCLSVPLRLSPLPSSSASLLAPPQLKKPFDWRTAPTVCQQHRQLGVHVAWVKSLAFSPQVGLSLAVKRH